MELLGGFEPPTSSLPTDWEGEVGCFWGLFTLFLSGAPCYPVLLCPLIPSAFFGVWVTVWVSLQPIRYFIRIRYNANPAN